MGDVRVTVAWLVEGNAIRCRGVRGGGVVYKPTEAMKVMRRLTIFTALLLVLPAVSQAKTLEDLLVEKGVITKSEARAAHHTGNAKVYWNKGTRLDFADTGFTAKIGTQLQTRYTFTDGDSDAGADNTSSFQVKRARIWVAGSALHGEFDYKIQGDFAGSSAKLKDAYLRWNACDQASLKMGQFKPAVSRQNYNSSTKLQFADRSEVSDQFAIDRNQGLSGEMDLADGVTLTAQAFNGLSNFLGDGMGTAEGANSVGVDTKHTGVVALRADLMGEMNPYSEGDVERTEDTAVNVGVAAAFSEAEDVLATNWDIFTLSADLNVKSNGTSFHGEFFYQENDPDMAGGTSVEGTGFYAQVGHFLDEDSPWEVAVRYGYIDCDDGAALGNNKGDQICLGNDDINEVNAGINYYWWKHHMKAQLGYSLLNEDPADSGGDDINTSRWLLQLSSWF